jgi:hypothetical protein
MTNLWKSVHTEEAVSRFVWRCGILNKYSMKLSGSAPERLAEKKDEQTCWQFENIWLSIISAIHFMYWWVHKQSWVVHSNVGIEVLFLKCNFVGSKNTAAQADYSILEITKKQLPNSIYRFRAKVLLHCSVAQWNTKFTIKVNIKKNWYLIFDLWFC